MRRLSIFVKLYLQKIINFSICNVSVETVKEAKEVLKSQRFDLVLLDINLPDGNGYEIAKTIREKYSDTIVTFLTANDRESDEIRGYGVGTVAYITKPFSIHSL